MKLFMKITWVIAFLLPVFALGNSPYPENPVVNIVFVMHNHEADVAKDMKNLEKSGAVNMHALSFTLHPENSPEPFDKIKNYAEGYKKILKQYDMLGKREAKVGVLIQSIMGHWKNDNPSPFQRIVSADNGKELYTYCPLDKNFQKYAKNCAKKVAELSPDFAMVDDDTRLISGRNACVCPLHIAELSKRLGHEITKEEVMRALKSSDEKSVRIGKVFDQLLGDSVCSLMRQIRDGFDEVNPNLPVIYCQCANDSRFSPAICEILAGKGNPKVCRINNALYWHGGETPRRFPFSSYRTAVQIQICKNIDMFLAETDPYPHNRYFTSARTLHTLFVNSIMEGCVGAKFWPNGSGIFDENSGDEYKRIFAEYSNYYKELSRAYKGFSAFGVTSPIPENKCFNWNPIRAIYTPAWNSVVFGRMGYAHNCATAEKASVFALDGRIVDELSDAELKKILSKSVIMDASAAMRLRARSMGNLIGMEVVNAVSENASELFEKNAITGELGGKFTPSSKNYEIVPNPDIQVISRYAIFDDVSSPQYRLDGIAVAAFENSLGGKIVVVANNVNDTKAFMSSSRKKMFTKIFQWFGGFPLEYGGDAEVYLRAGITPEGSILAEFVNLGFDKLENLKLKTAGPIKKVLRLKANGEWENLAFSKSGENIFEVDAQADVFLPVVLKIMH